MKTSEEHLEFAVNLAQDKRDLGTRELLKLRKDLEAFLQDHAVAGITFAAELSESAPLPEDYSIQDFQELQKNSYAVLSDIANGRYARIHSPQEFELRLQFSAAQIRKHRSMVFAYGSTRDAFLCKLFLLLGQQPADRILRCKAHDCDKIFYRRRNQEFCSTRCANRSFMKELRKIKSYRESENEEAHNRYKRRMKEINPGREVIRRPRKQPAG